MTYNLRRATWRDGAHAWPFRRDALAEAVERHAPEILGTQEGTIPMLVDLDERLRGYRRVGDREHWPGEEPNAIYYDPERVRVLDAGVFWLSHTPLTPSRGKWGGWARRSAMWALFVHARTRAPMLVVNTHLDHVSMLARRRSAQLLARTAPEAVLMGDFNAWPRRFVHTVLLAGRQDPLAGARHTHNAFTGRDRGRIDWILVPETMRVLRGEVLDPRRADGSPASDHLPVVVEVEPPTTKRPLALPDAVWDAATPVETKLPPPPWDVQRDARRLAEQASA